MREGRVKRRSLFRFAETSESMSAHTGKEILDTEGIAGSEASFMATYSSEKKLEMILFAREGSSRKTKPL